MKIAFVLDDSLDKTDGVQQYVTTLGRWLSTHDHEVHYLVGHTERKDLHHVHSLSRNVQAHFNQNRMSTPLPVNKNKLKQLLNDEDFDILHVQMPYSPFLAGRIIKLAPARAGVVGTFHIIPYSRLELVANTILGIVLRRSLKRFDAIFSVSEPARRFAKRSYGIKSEVLPNVINLSHYQAARKIRKYTDDKLNIVFLGRLVERKGCMDFLRALTELNKKNELNRVRVIIAGKGPLLNSLQGYVSDNHLKHVVRFLGFVSEEEKPDLLASADIAVFPSTGGESFGIVLIEAMAAGAGVVLAGNNKGYSSVMRARKQQIFDPKNTKQFANVLRHYLNNQRARKQSYRWQMEYVAQFDVRSVGSRLIDTYESVIANTDR